MKLHFNKQKVKQILAHSLESTNHVALDGEGSTACPGLHLVGEEGIYLMSNGIPSQRSDGSSGIISPQTPRLVVYAVECDPTRMEFEDWWKNKKKSFGEDDDIEFIDASEFQSALKLEGEWLVIDLTPEEITVVEYL